MLVVSVRAIVFHAASLAASVVLRSSGTASRLQGSQTFQFLSGVANELISWSGRPGRGFGGGCYGSSHCTPGKGFDGNTFHHTGATGHHGQRPHTFRFGGLMHHGLNSARRQLRPIDGKGADGFNGQNGQNGYGASVHNGNVVPHNYTAGHPQMSKAQAGSSEHAAYAGLNGVQHDRTLQHAWSVQPSGRPGKGFGGGCYGSSDCTPGNGFDGNTFHHTGATGHHGQRPHTSRFGGLMPHGLKSARRQLRPIDGKGADGFNGQNGQHGIGASVINGRTVHLSPEALGLSWLF